MIMLLSLSTYIASRGILYFFFVLRAYDTFQHSDMAYAKSTLYAMLFLPLLIFSLAIIPTVWEQWTHFDYYISSDASGHGVFCYRDRS